MKGANPLAIAGAAAIAAALVPFFGSDYVALVLDPAA